MTETLILDIETKGADTAKKDLDNVSKAVEKADDEQKEYNRTLKDTVEEMEVFGVSIGSIKKSLSGAIGVIRNSVSALKTFKIALASTGVGALVIGLGSLVTFLTKTQNGMNIVNRATEVVSQTIGVLVERVGFLGEAIFKAFSGDFSGAMETAKMAFTDVGAQIETAYDNAIELSNAQDALTEKTIKYTVENAKLNLELQEQRRISEDLALSVEERLEANERAIALTEELEQRELELLRESIRLEELRQEATASTYEEQQALAELRAELLNREAETEEKLTELQNKNRALVKEDMDARKRETFEVTKRGIESSNEVTKVTLENIDKIETAEERLGDTRKRLNKEELKLASDLFAETTKNLLSFAGNVKELAIFEVIVNTAVAIAKAWKDENDIILKISASLAAASAGAVALSQIRSTPVPQFADGGMIYGPSHKRGGVLLEAEGGEYIINKRSMALPGVRQQVEHINSLGLPKYEYGGAVPDMSYVNMFTNLEKQIASNRAVLVVEDLTTALSAVEVRDELSTL